MANKRPKPEEIVTKLRQVEVLTGQGMPRLDAIRQIGGEPCCAIGPSDNGERTDLLPMEEEIRWNGHGSIEGTEASTERERAAEKGRIGSDAGQIDFGGGSKGKLLSPARRRACIDRVRAELNVSERRACRVLRQRRRWSRKRALVTRRPILVPDRANQRWSLDFVSDAFEDGQRFRVLCIVDDCTREALATVVDRSLSGARMTRELDELMDLPRILGSMT